MSNFNRTACLQLSAAVAAALFAAHAQSADETGMMYFNPLGGYTFLDSKRDRDDDFHYGISAGFHATEHVSVEFNGLWADFGGKNGATLHQGAYSLDGLFVFNRPNTFSPYITLGGGYLQNNFNGPTNWGGPMAQAGVGALIDVAEGHSGGFVFQIRPEVKYRHDWPDSPHGHDDAGDVLVSLGFMFNFGPGHAAPMAVAQTAPPPPPPPPPPAPPPPPMDSDGDGVPDSADRCPDTPRGTVVDEKGCPTEPVVLKGVEFETASATLTVGSRPVLDGVAQDLLIHPLVQVELQGHTDSQGADAYNMELSQRRADSVRDYLMSKGVSGTRLVAKGYGETQPIADNKTAAGRAQNRRVVMKVIANPNNAEIHNDTPH